MNNKKTLTAEKVAEIRAKGIDFSDIPEITDFTAFNPDTRNISNLKESKFQLD